MEIEIIDKYKFICPDGEKYNGIRMDGELIFIGSLNTIINKNKDKPFTPSLGSGNHRYYKGIKFEFLVAYSYGLIKSIDEQCEILFEDDDTTNCSLDNLIVIHTEQPGRRFLKNPILVCYDYKTTKVLGFYKSIVEAAKTLGIQWTGIDKVIKGKYKKTHGYYFEWMSKSNILNGWLNQNGNL